MAVDLLARKPVNLLASDEEKPKSLLDTFYPPLEKGKMPAMFTPGTPEHTSALDEMLWGAIGNPGMKIVDQAARPGPISRLAGTVGKTIKSAFTKVEPLEQKAAEAIKPYEENLAKAETGLQEAESEATPVKPDIYEEPKTQLENIENEIGKHINVKGQHDIAASHAITNHVESIESFWSDAFKELENKLSNAKFMMPQNVMEKLKYTISDSDILKRIFAGANPKKVEQDMLKEKMTAENPYFKDLLQYAPTQEDTSASAFLAKYRDFRDALGGLKQDLKSENILSGEKRKIKEAITQAKAVEGQIKEALNSGLGEHKAEFDWINKGYSEQVFPLRKNPLVKAAKKGKLSETDIMSGLRTDESGMPLLREVVKRDPELVRNIVGQRYKLNPSEVHNPDAMMREYLDEMPDFKQLLGQKEKTLEEVATKKNISLAEKLKAENELKNIRKEEEIKLKDIISGKKKAQKKLKKAAYIAGGAVLGAPYGKKFINMFSGED